MEKKYISGDNLELLIDGLKIGTAADWDINDSKDVKYVANRTHYDSRIFKSVEYTFDGIPDGKEQANMYGDIYVKISDDILSYESLVDKDIDVSCLVDNEVQTEVVNIPRNFYGGYYDNTYAFIVVTDETLFFDGSFPSKGVYVWYTDEQNYVKNFTLQYFLGELKQLDKKYIPDTIARVEDVDASLADVDSAISDLNTDVSGLKTQVNNVKIDTSRVKSQIEEDMMTYYDFSDLALNGFSIGDTQIKYGNNRFVALTNHGQVAYSDNGITWRCTKLPSARDYSSWTLAFGNNKFIAASAICNIIAYSQDGISWSEYTLPSVNGIRRWTITYGNGKFVAVGDVDTVVLSSGNMAMYSKNGINWTVTTMPHQDFWRSLAYGNGKFVATTSSSSNRKCAYSEDGIVWNIATLPNNASHVVYGNNMFVAAKNGSDIVMYSEDGIIWNTSKLPFSARLNIFAYAADKFFIASADGKRVAYSEDSIHWVEAETSNNMTYRAAMAYGNDTFVMLDYNDGWKNYYGEDGINWYNKTLIQNDKSITGEVRDLIIGVGSKRLATEEYVNASRISMRLTDQTTGFQYTIAVDNGSLVSAPRPFTYTITTVPTTTTYTAGEYFDATGLATAVVYDDDSRVEITDYHFPVEYLAKGTTEVAITAEILGSEYSATTDVTVTALDPATYLADYTYTDNGDGTYTVTGWADTTKTDELTIPNNYFVKMGG